MATLPQLLEGHAEVAAQALPLLESVVTAPGPLGAEAAARLARIAVVFGAPASGQGNSRRRLSVAGGKDAAG